MSHNEVVKREFTLQAAAYAGLPHVSDQDRIDRLVHAVGVSADARVLDVATGPGYVAAGFAAHCLEVVGMDLTGAPLERAEALRAQRGLTNLRFVIGDAEQLPFEAASFDAVVCRHAFHHFEYPPTVLAEMARVCRAGGIIGVEDLITSEQPGRAAYQNRIERLRDPSHVRALPLSELIHLFAHAGLELESVYTDHYLQLLHRWLATTQTPADRAAQIQRLLERDEVEDLSGRRPFRQDGVLAFVHHTGAVIGRKLAGRAQPR